MKFYDGCEDARERFYSDERRLDLYPLCETWMSREDQKIWHELGRRPNMPPVSTMGNLVLETRDAERMSAMSGYHSFVHGGLYLINDAVR